jgi:hypothetical protein
VVYAPPAEIAAWMMREVGARLSAASVGYRLGVEIPEQLDPARTMDLMQELWLLEGRTFSVKVTHQQGNTVNFVKL